MFPLHDTLPSATTPWIVRGLVICNVAAFLLSMSDLESAARNFGAVATHYTGLEPTPVLAQDEEGRMFEILPVPPSHVALRTASHMFVHGGFLHLASNLWFLWIFGDNVEDRMGRVRMLLTYVVSGLAALALQVAVTPRSGLPLVGASGAISGILGAYTVAFPQSRVVTIVPLGFYPLLLALPARFFLLVWLAIQILSGLGRQSGGGVAWWAHIGGFVMGALLMLLLAPRRPRRIQVDLDAS